MIEGKEVHEADGALVPGGIAIGSEAGAEAELSIEVKKPHIGGGIVDIDGEDHSSHFPSP